MLRLRSCSAVLHRPPTLLRDTACVREVARAKASQARSPAAVYAVQAVETLDLDGREPALYCIAGPVGSCLHFLEKARPPDSRQLLSADFGRRSRRIHPFTVLLSLQNQVAATLSLHFGWRRSCMNSLDEPTSFVDLIPSMEIRQRTDPVLVVMSSAADRRDDRDWHDLHDPGQPVLEGAVALLFEARGGMGEIRGVEPDRNAVRAGPELFSERPVAPGLEAGLGCLVSITRGSPRDVYELRAADRSAYFEWRAA